MEEAKMKEQMKNALVKFETIPVGIIDDIVNSLAQELGKITVPKDEFNNKVAEVNSYKGLITERDGSIAELKKTAGLSDQLKQQIETLQTDSAAKTKDLENKLETEQLNFKNEKTMNAVKLSALNFDVDGKKFKARNADDVTMFMDKSKFEIGADGNITNLNVLFKDLVEKRPYLFEGDEPAGGKFGGNFGGVGGKPGAGGGTDNEVFAQMDNILGINAQKP